MNDLNDLLRGTSCQSLENSRNQAKRKENRDDRIAYLSHEIILILYSILFSIRYYSFNYSTSIFDSTESIIGVDRYE